MAKNVETAQKRQLQMMATASKKVRCIRIVPLVVKNDATEKNKSLNVNLERGFEHQRVAAFVVVLKDQPLTFGEELRPPV